MKLLAATTVAIAVAANIAEAEAATSTDVLKRRFQISTYKIQALEGRWHWTLRPRFDKCSDLRFRKPQNRCYRARQGYRWHKARIERIRAVLWPPAPVVRYVDARAAICAVFGPYCSQAISVAACETGGTFSTSAQNGQYLGLFQMGASERATYGHASDAYGQARAAFRYFVASGSDWSPWSCKP